MTGRMPAVGDIHGCDVALETLLRDVATVATDTIVVLGDVVDSGPYSRGVLDPLFRFAKEVQLICMMGNHDEMMLESLAAGIDVACRRRAGDAGFLSRVSGGNPDGTRAVFEIPA